jgi:ketosteroid isomerase-like protein
MGSPVTAEFLDRYAEAWNRHDVEAILSMMTTDAVMFTSAGPYASGQGVRGRDALRAVIADSFRAMPDARWNGATHFVAGDRGVTQCVFSFTRPDGTRVETPGCDIFAFRDGLIAVKDSLRKQAAY